MTSFEIRTATVDDARTVRDVGLRTFMETFGSANTPENMSLYLASAFSMDAVRREIQQEGTTTLLLRAAGEDVGYALLRLGLPPPPVVGSSPIELVRLYVDAAVHGTGAGAALMEAALDVARGKGCDVIWLGVWENNARAQAFYRKWGFERAGKQTFMLGADAQTDWLMVRQLPSGHFDA